MRCKFNASDADSACASVAHILRNASENDLYNFLLALHDSFGHEFIIESVAAVGDMKLQGNPFQDNWNLDQSPGEIANSSKRKTYYIAHEGGGL